MADKCREKHFHKIGPWGGLGGSHRDIAEPRRLRSITVNTTVVGNDEVLNSISFIYEDESGKEHEMGPWGRAGGSKDVIQLGYDNYVKELAGTLGMDGHSYVVNSLKIVTNKGVEKEWGTDDGNTLRFSVPVGEGSSIVGFFGRSGRRLDQIGVYVRGA